ncbi:hypothetical protein TFLX_00458 [Thermoflexales bacterium]|nr:hypothetical protein TFLX_00458 [Thermoflexales bacterium]
MQSASILSPSKPSGKFSLPGMVVALAGGIAVVVSFGAIFSLITSAISFSIPLVVPAMLGAVVGYATMKLGTSFGRCRNPKLAVSVAIIAGVVAWGTQYVIDYGRFRSVAFATIVHELPQATSQQVDHFVDQWLQEETGQSGLVGFMFLKADSESIEITSHQYGVPLAGFRLSGFSLVIYWLIELLMIVGLAAYINRSYAKQPYCDQCETWRDYEVPMLGSPEHVDEAITAFQRRDIPTAIEALGTCEQGDFIRLEIEYCPRCFEDAYAKLVAVHDTGQPKHWTEQLLWSNRLDPNLTRQVLELAR